MASRKPTCNPDAGLEGELGMNEIFYIDLFSGAGGTTTGIHMVGSGAKVVACVNHDTNAIESHKPNKRNTSVMLWFLLWQKP